MKRVLVGLDGSAASLDALHWTVALADAAAAAAVTAVYAFTPSYAEVSLDQYEVLRAQAEQRLIGWSADSASRRPVDSLVIGGDPTVLLTAARQNADLLVVGTRGAGGFAHLHLGSCRHPRSGRVQRVAARPCPDPSGAPHRRRCRDGPAGSERIGAVTARGQPPQPITSLDTHEP